MNTLRQFAVLLVTVAIGLSSCQKAVGKVTPVKSDFTFLKKLGIETTGGIVLPDSIDREHIDSRHDAAFMLDFDKQAVPLLDEVLDLTTNPDQRDVMNYILGIKALPGYFTLVAYERAYGDGTAAYVGIYDRQGRLTDFMNCGKWFREEPAWQGEDNQCLVERRKSLLKFVAPGEFVIVRDQSLYSGIVDTTQFESTKTGCKWKIVNELHYKVDAQGHIMLERTVCNKSQNVPATSAFTDKVDEAIYLPRSLGQESLDRLNRLATSSGMVRFESLDNATDAFNGIYDLALALSDRYQYDPQLVLSWMASHRGPGGSRLTRVFEFVFAYSMIPKEVLVKDIESMQDPEARRYIERLTAQWGPRDAVG